MLIPVAHDYLQITTLSHGCLQILSIVITRRLQILWKYPYHTLFTDSKNPYHTLFTDPMHPYHILFTDPMHPYHILFTDLMYPYHKLFTDSKNLFLTLFTDPMYPYHALFTKFILPGVATIDFNILRFVIAYGVATLFPLSTLITHCLQILC